MGKWWGKWWGKPTIFKKIITDKVCSNVRTLICLIKGFS
jgi:hypothetical protein